MRKFLIASTKYQGNVEVVYAADVLQRICFAQAALSPAQRQAFKAIVPVQFAEFEATMRSQGATVVEEDYTVSFDDYWRLVRKKINRKRCEQLWARMSKVAQVQAVSALPHYYKYLARKERQEADPENYLRNEYYNTEWAKLP